MRRTRGEAVDGVLLLDKPVGLTSNAALLQARRLLAARKAGHTGTLDPLASGLLPLLFGEATKFAADLLDADKTYEATLKLGITTSTGDAEGEPVRTRAVAVSAEDLKAVLARFVGDILQVPPMHSALKRDGQPLYKLARAGRTVERAARQVSIRELCLLALDGDCVRIAVACSKGTYIRVLAEDVGEALGCGAHLTALRRMQVGALRLDAAATLAGLEALPLAQRRASLQPVDALLTTLPQIVLEPAQATRFGCGQRLSIGARAAARVRVYAEHGRLLGIASIDDQGCLAPTRLMQQCGERSAEVIPNS